MRTTVKKQFYLTVGVARKLEALATAEEMTEKEWIVNVIRNWEIFTSGLQSKRSSAQKNTAKPVKSVFYDGSDGGSNNQDQEDNQEHERDEEESEETEEEIQEKKYKEEARIAKLKRQGKYIPKKEEIYGVDWRVQNGNQNQKVSGQILIFKDAEERADWAKTTMMLHRYEILDTAQKYNDAVKLIQELKELDINPDPYAEEPVEIDHDAEFAKWEKEQAIRSAKIRAERKRKGIVGNPLAPKLSPEDEKRLNHEIKIGEKRLARQEKKEAKEAAKKKEKEKEATKKKEEKKK